MLVVAVGRTLGQPRQQCKDVVFPVYISISIYIYIYMLFLSQSLSGTVRHGWDVGVDSENPGWRPLLYGSLAWVGPETPASFHRGQDSWSRRWGRGEEEGDAKEGRGQEELVNFCHSSLNAWLFSLFLPCALDYDLGRHSDLSKPTQLVIKWPLTTEATLVFSHSVVRFATPWTSGHQTSLSFTVSQSHLSDPRVHAHLLCCFHAGRIFHFGWKFFKLPWNSGLSFPWELRSHLFHFVFLSALGSTKYLDVMAEVGFFFFSFLSVCHGLLCPGG